MLYNKWPNVSIIIRKGTEEELQTLGLFSVSVRNL